MVGAGYKLLGMPYHLVIWTIKNTYKVLKEALNENYTSMQRKMDIRHIETLVDFHFKRASNILENEMRNNKVEIDNTTDPGIFKSDFEKNLYKKVNEIQKYYSTINNDEKRGKRELKDTLDKTP